MLHLSSESIQHVQSGQVLSFIKLWQLCPSLELFQAGCRCPYCCSAFEVWPLFYHPTRIRHPVYSIKQNMFIPLT